MASTRALVNARPMPRAPPQMVSMMPPRRNPATNFLGDASSPEGDGRAPIGRNLLAGCCRSATLWHAVADHRSILRWRSARASRSYASQSWPKGQPSALPSLLEADAARCQHAARTIARSWRPSPRTHADNRRGCGTTRRLNGTCRQTTASPCPPDHPRHIRPVADRSKQIVESDSKRSSFPLAVDSPSRLSHMLTLAKHDIIVRRRITSGQVKCNVKQIGSLRCDIF
jgi:hypothetical protein